MSDVWESKLPEPKSGIRRPSAISLSQSSVEHTNARPSTFSTFSNFFTESVKPIFLFHIYISISIPLIGLGGGGHFSSLLSPFFTRMPSNLLLLLSCFQ